jgi:pimeloyl-ACP methyl ester carboxylesterase/DNA-binding CsgD family transcriptional regulator
MAEQPVTRYATGSGAHIAYQVLGHGPAILIVPGFASHLDVEWEDGACRSFIRRLAAFATVVRFDKRGTGLSDPVQELPTLLERDADLAAVIADAGVDRPVLLGFSEGGSIVVRFAVTHHESVRGLILYGTSAHSPPPWAMEQLRMAAAAWGTGASIELFARSQADDPGARREQARFERASASPALARALVESLMLVDVESLLPSISVPTLVVHRTQDVIPVEEGRFLASRIPSSRFKELAGVDHRPWVGDSQAVINEIERFLVSLAPAVAESRGPGQPKRRRPVRQTTGWASLTEREQAVAALVTAGCSNPEIARRLYISRETVQTHLKHVFVKLGVDSRTALAAIAVDHLAARNP